MHTDEAYLTMIRIHIVHVGTIKEKYLTDAVAEYEKRLGAYCSIDNISVREERLPEKPSEPSRKAFRIPSYLRPESFLP